MRYSKYRREAPTKKQTNPIWRGIGCILVLIAPVLAFAIANQVMLSGLVQQYISIPRNLRQTVTLPGIGYDVPFFYATLVLTAAVLVALFALAFTVYALLYRIVGPSPYGPTDVPPVRPRGKIRRSR